MSLLHLNRRNEFKYFSKGPGKRGHIVAHDVSWAAQTGKHLLWTQNVSEQNQKHFLCPGHKVCVHNNVSTFARALTVNRIVS